MTKKKPRSDQTGIKIRVDEVEAMRLMCHLIAQRREVRAVHWNDARGKQRSHDCDLVLERDRKQHKNCIIAVEITQHTNPDQEAQEAHNTQQNDLGKLSKKSKQLKQDWFIELKPRNWLLKTNRKEWVSDIEKGISEDRTQHEVAKRLQGVTQEFLKQLPMNVRPLEDILHDLEDQGIEDRIVKRSKLLDLDIESCDFDDDTHSVDWELYALGVVCCSSCPGTGEMTVWGTNEGTAESPCTPANQVGPEYAQTPEEVVRIHLETNKKKLERANSRDERHLFIWLKQGTAAYDSTVIDMHLRKLPADVPELPETLDMVWLAPDVTSETFGSVWSVDKSGWKLHNPFKQPEISVDSLAKYMLQS